ncbi:molecular chaperone TorD family protein [Roseobacter sp. YSTF-M11]|uniref:Molecular chaperone TorD family protein n=1 Tax=Roseobacter insulae TaxID=2859783 RepID=A0A9X1FYQ0_9RHOB|nr:molecular chaperone TorD family protein [Roseobacter insulae]MBW4710058.1 molecular chaperone TorD family protein [Roseobacter insulae]
MSAAMDVLDVAPEDRLRADLYNFLGLALARPADQMLLDQMSELSGDDSAMGQAVAGLARVAKASTPKGVEREFNALFIGLGRGELLPYASYYLTGFLNEKPLARLRKDMGAHQITRAENVFEPEDSMASLMEIMGGMIVGRFGQPAPLDRQRMFFNNHIAPWATHFYSDLEAANASILYASIGSLGREFMSIEKEAFRLTAV